METIISQIQSDLADLQNNPNGLTYEQLILFYDKICANVTDFESQNKESKTIAIKWSTEDVLWQADNLDIELTKEQAEDILESLGENHDASIGINWDVIASYIEAFISKDRD
jgi:hypothetical protein